MNEGNITHLVIEFQAACDDVNADMDDRLHALEYLVAQEASNTAPGMTAGWHAVDVLTHMFERISKNVRGRLARYGHSDTPSR